MSPVEFRKAFPEFSDLVKYPNEQVCMWLELSEAQTNVNRWRRQKDIGVGLYTAHQLTLSAQSQAAGNIGGTPGGATGVVNSKTVGSVTVAYDTQQGAERDGGWWNLTNYGKQFLRLARIFGSGAVSL